MRLRLSRKQPEPQQILPQTIDHYVDLPAGTCLETENGFFYINKKNNIILRYKISTYRILDSWKFPYVVHSTEKIFSRVKVAGFLGFRTGTVIKDISTGLIYVVDGSLKRKIESPDYLLSLGIDPKEVLLVSKDEVNLHKDGEVIK